MNDRTTLKERVSRLVNHSPFAVLSTVGGDGRPYCRWMSPVLVTGNLNEVDSLVLRGSRKIQQIVENPQVTWLFQSPGFDEVVSLHGEAWVDADPGYKSLVWDRMPDRHRTLFFRAKDYTGFEVLRTRIEEIEYIQPLAGEFKPEILRGKEIGP